MRYLWALRNTVIISFVLFFLCRFLSSLPVLLNPSEFLINLVYIVIITFAHFLNSSEKYLILFVSVFLLHAKSVRDNFLINLVYISLYYNSNPSVTSFVVLGISILSLAIDIHPCYAIYYCFWGELILLFWNSIKQTCYINMSLSYLLNGFYILV